MFTQRHYIAIADVIRVQNFTDPTDRDALVNDFARLFGADNPSFKRARFLKACGVET